MELWLKYIKQKMNPGFDPQEIEQLKAECKTEGKIFVRVEDELDLSETGDYAQFQFVGQKDGKDVIYDVAMFALELHYQSSVLEEAERRLAKIRKDFVPLDEREANYKPVEEHEELLEEFMEEIEEEDELKVSEYLEIDESFDFGIGIEVALNEPEITDEVIHDFIIKFNAGNLNLDPNLYSYKHEEE